MSTYAIGDIHGCYDTLQRLLDKIAFTPQTDRLWFTGDLINRGPQSLQTLRFIKSLGDSAITVLGNHDLHLLAVAAGVQTVKMSDTIDNILNAADSTQLVKWLSQQPLLHHDMQLGFTLAHAGLAPQWGLTQAQACAHEVENALRSDKQQMLLKHMYSKEPACWQDSLQGIKRLRCIINYFTRMRFLDRQGCLNFTLKGAIDQANNDLIPWFNFPQRKMKNNNIIFGHWAALSDKTTTPPHVFALDTGCVWGKQLTAFCLDNGRYTRIP